MISNKNNVEESVDLVAVATNIALKEAGSCSVDCDYDDGGKEEKPGARAKVSPIIGSCGGCMKSQTTEEGKEEVVLHEAKCQHEGGGHQCVDLDCEMCHHHHHHLSTPTKNQMSVGVLGHVMNSPEAYLMRAIPDVNIIVPQAAIGGAKCETVPDDNNNNIDAAHHHKSDDDGEKNTPRNKYRLSNEGDIVWLHEDQLDVNQYMGVGNENVVVATKEQMMEKETAKFTSCCNKTTNDDNVSSSHCRENNSNLELKVIGGQQQQLLADGRVEVLKRMENEDCCGGGNKEQQHKCCQFRVW